MKKYIFPVIVSLLFSLVPFHLIVKHTIEENVRANVVQLVSDKGSCTGTQVKAPSGKRYVLTASHCKGLADKNNRIMVKAEGLRPIALAIVEESTTTDLLLLEGHPQLKGLKLGSTPTRFTKLKAYTHGKGMATYEANGKYIQMYNIQMLDHFLATPEEEQACLVMPKYKVEEINLLFLSVKACIMSIDGYVTNVSPIAPGSSGGALVSGNKIVGVMVAIDDNGFSFAVPLKDVKEFLAPY